MEKNADAKERIADTQSAVPRYQGLNGSHPHQTADSVGSEKCVKILMENTEYALRVDAMRILAIMGNHTISAPTAERECTEAVRMNDKARTTNRMAESLLPTV